MTRRVRALAGALVVATSGCGSGEVRSTTSAHVVAGDRVARLEAAFEGEPALLVAVRPARLGRDALYGPLLRRASELAAARAGVGGAVGTTALAALERTDEVLVGVYDRDAQDAVVALRGVPAEVDSAHLVDAAGHALWVHLRDLPRGVEELVPADGSPGAALFVLPRRAWVVAVGAAVVRARRAYVDGAPGSDPHLALDDEPLAIARVRGDAILRARPSLGEGPLAPVVRDLDAVTLSLEPGPQGQVGEVVARLVYGDAPFAQRAEACARDVLGAFTRRYEQRAPWLHAVSVSREERAVVVRGRIPRAWADGLAHLELDQVPP